MIRTVEDLGAHLGAYEDTSASMEERCHVCKGTDTETSPCTCFICHGCATRTRDEDATPNPVDKTDEGMYCKQCIKGEVK